MAEVAPLTSAHAHARKAAEEIRDGVHRSSAAEEHTSAATDFAKAARTTSDFEALRILRLLEDQHKRLATIIKTQDADHDDTAVVEPQAARMAAKQLKPETVISPEKAGSARPQSTTSALAAARSGLGSHARDSSPSLAREIASRRGIPQSDRTRPSPAAQARARQLSPESQRRSSRSSKPSPAVPPSVVDSQADLRRAKAKKAADDDAGFHNFFSNLTTGTTSKLSSVLAYAGLPLTADDIIKPDSPTETKHDPRASMLRSKTVPASDGPDVKRYFSKAALNALEDQHRERGTLGRGFNPAESFYVVPTSGMMTSYAEMARQRSSAIPEEEGEFVDAREHAGPPSPRLNRSKTIGAEGTGSRTGFGSNRTQEELELENVTLKQTLEQLAVRLANFEAHAQDASMAALTQSMMLHQPTQQQQQQQQRVRGPTILEGTTSDREVELQRQLEALAAEREQWKQQAEKEAKDNRKWNARYEQLKTKAKAKQAAKLEAGGKAPDSPQLEVEDEPGFGQA